MCSEKHLHLQAVKDSMIDIISLKIALDVMHNVISTFKYIKDLLPSGSEKDNIKMAIVDAERRLRLAEAQIAEGLDYPLCRCTFPPQIMLYDSDSKRYVCPICNNTEEEKGSVGVMTLNFAQHG